MFNDFINLTPEHKHNLLNLCSLALPLDPFTQPLLDKHIFDDPRYEPELSIALESTGDLIAAVVGMVRTLPEGNHHGWIKLLAVHPDHRRRGLGMALLREIEHSFRQRRLPQIDTIGFPRYFWPGVDVRYTPACCLFETAGFKETRTLVNMAVDLTQPFDTASDEQQLAADGFTFHRAALDDAEELNAFIEREWPPWCDEVPIALANDPISLFYCRLAGKIVGYAAYDIAMFPGTFGSMGTDVACRGRGVGSVLLRLCLADMQAIKCPRCEIAWVGPVGFYARQVNAHINRVFRDYRKLLDE